VLSVIRRQTENNQFQISQYLVSTPYYIQSDATKLYVRNFPVKLDLVESREEEGGTFKIYVFSYSKSFVGNFLVSLFLGYFRIPYPYKIVHEERILPINKKLLVLGNVTKSMDGNYYISQAKEGSQI
jgi:hypothetical protein